MKNDDPSRPKPPKDLSQESAAYFLSITDEYELGLSDLKILTLACRQWDRAIEARDALKKGATYKDNHGVIRPRPEVLMERNSIQLFAKLVRALNLPEPEERKNA
jgi:phage terminase small subunit